MFSEIFKFFFGNRDNRKGFSSDSENAETKDSFDSGQYESGPLFSRKESPQGQYPLNWDEIRRPVLARDNGHCQVTGCLNYFKSSQDQFGDLEMHVHHKRAMIDGGSDDLDNLVTLCAFHHGLIHFDNQLLKEKIPSSRFTLVCPYWKRARWNSERHHVQASVRRFKSGYVAKEELRQVRDYFGLVCNVPGCGSNNWQGDYIMVRKGFKKHWSFETRCKDCGDRWVFDRGLREETGFQIANAFRVTQNQGKFIFDSKLIVGLEEPIHFEGCPICPSEGRHGYLIKRIRKDTGEFFLACSEWQRGQGCNYTRNTRQ